MLELVLQNNQSDPITNFVMKLNKNYLGLQLDEDFPQITIFSGQSQQINLKLHMRGPFAEAPVQPPVLIQTGLMCSLDLFYFDIPALLQIAFTKSEPIDFTLTSPVTN